MKTPLGRRMQGHDAEYESASVWESGHGPRATNAGRKTLRGSSAREFERREEEHDGMLFGDVYKKGRMPIRPRADDETEAKLDLRYRREVVATTVTHCCT